MINLFKKFSTVSTTAIAVFCSFACSDKVAGTAEEPNQFAYRDSSSSEEIDSINDTLSYSSSSRIIDPVISSSSSRKDGDGTVPIPITGSSSSTTLDIELPIGGNGQAGHSGSVYASLDDYLRAYNITEVAFDTNVLAYNKTFDNSRNTDESAKVAELRTLGLHKITSENAIGLAKLFLGTTIFMNGKVYEKDGNISFQTDGCPLYILNITDTSPAVHVLTNITKDTITVADIHDNCVYEPSPYEKHVGFLIAYCGELSEDPKIERTFTLKESMACNSAVYDEFINKKPSNTMQKIELEQRN